MRRVRTGLDRVAAAEPDVVRLLRGRRLGLLAHPASVDARLRHAREVLRAAGGRLEALFGPEHGFGGEAQDMVGIQGDRQSGVRVPMYSLYGDSEQDLSPRAEWVDGLDAIVIDLQDVGSRYYTFVWTAALTLRAAAARGVETIVLDRPNPLGGNVVEGAPQRPGYRSFVGLYDVSIRHGMTIAEILSLVAEQEDIDEGAFHVVTMDGWQRWMRWEDTELPWVLPSPNMPTVATARVYPGGCLVEGTNLSEGRGTTRPFEIWGAPFVEGPELAARVETAGAILRPLHFQPTFHKHAGRRCGGVQVHVSDERSFRPYEAYMRLIAEVRRLAPDRFAWRTEPYEFVADRPAIDLLTGGPEYREAVDEGRPLDGVLEAERRGADAFIRRRERYLRYERTPEDSAGP